MFKEDDKEHNKEKFTNKGTLCGTTLIEKGICTHPYIGLSVASLT
jgi:hypothetical protein